MNKLPYYFIILLLLSSCETEEQKKEKAQEVVQALISNIQVDNYESIYEYYPRFKEWKGKYWKYSSVEISSTMLKDDGTVEIFAKTNNNNQLYFLLDKIDGNYKVLKSKGLSGYFNSNLYKYCKNIGCIGTNETDLDIGRICEENEFDFKFLTNEIKNVIERNTKLENQTLNKAGGSYGLQLYVSGDLIVKNYSRFTLPGYSYDIYINFLDNNDEVVLRYKYYSNFSEIPYNSSETLHIMKNIDKSCKTVDVELVIINTDFIEEIIGEYAKGSLCNYSNNL